MVLVACKLYRCHNLCNTVLASNFFFHLLIFSFFYFQVIVLTGVTFAK